ncbi:MAG: glycoside hydrolase family 3 C-terminal domain-containing protein, partial [Muribaculaceae bacterium]|nr:glycoside hydrolase family 3 C-terminal domain-containing protein [Muribaculaceae bacterium]
PELWCSDGPHGVRAEVLWDAWKDAGWTNDSITAFPALTCLAATWNPEMSAIYGKAVGEEARYRKKDVLLGPGVNMLRTPLNGRNFEYMGEDPYLASVMVVPYIKGVQSNGVAACVKHFALNSEEINRHTVSVDVSDRALYEIYLPAFKAAVMDGGVWSIMSSYNLYRGRHVSQHPRLLKDILRGEWGFDGAVISDWGAVHNSPEAIEGGLDLEYGSWTNVLDDGSRNAFDNYYMAGPYLDRIMAGELDTKELDVKAANVLRLIMRTAMGKKNSYGVVGNDEHIRVARTIGTEGIVLLKNDNNILPLDVASGRKKIAVIGENAVKMMTSAGGSSKLKVKYEVAPLDGLRRSIGDKADIVFARGYVGQPSGHYMLDGKKYQLKDTRSAQELKDEALN